MFLLLFVMTMILVMLRMPQVIISNLVQDMLFMLHEIVVSSLLSGNEVLGLTRVVWEMVVHSHENVMEDVSVVEQSERKHGSQEVQHVLAQFDGQGLIHLELHHRGDRGLDDVLVFVGVEALPEDLAED